MTNHKETIVEKSVLIFVISYMIGKQQILIKNQ